MKKYIVDKDADMVAPDWLSFRIDYINIKFAYCSVEGAVWVTAERGSGVVEIGDRILCNCRRLSGRNTLYGNQWGMHKVSILEWILKSENSTDLKQRIESIRAWNCPDRIKTVKEHKPRRTTRILLAFLLLSGIRYICIAAFVLWCKNEYAAWHKIWHKTKRTLISQGSFSRSDKTWTCGLFVPNEALYHLSHTPILSGCLNRTSDILLQGMTKVNTYFKKN